MDERERALLEEAASRHPSRRGEDHAHRWRRAFGQYPFACAICGRPGVAIPADMLDAISR